jgi:hypothetical protein
MSQEALSHGRADVPRTVVQAYHVGRTLLRLVLYAEDAGTLDRDSAFIRALLAYWKVDQVDQLLERTVHAGPRPGQIDQR